MILVAGELLIDMVTTELVTDLSKTNTLQIKAGGSAANFARFCKKLGADVNLVATVGKDGFGEFALQAIKESGLLTNYIKQLTCHNTSVIVVGKSHSTPEFIPYRDADNHIEPVPDKLIAQCTVFHTTAFALSRQPAQDKIMEAFDKIIKAKKLISIDWNYAKKIWGQNNNAAILFDSIMSYRPLLKISMDDACRFWNIDNDIEEVKQKLDHYNYELVCLTNGANGVYYKKNGNPWNHKPNLPTNVIDVTGAGDAFWSGFITCYLSNYSLEPSIDMALKVAKDRLEQRI